ncbi:MAG: hypothetical protein HYY04_08440 [Chloroflexi bacterium]|nr:hypothetical protein [Chloroflexota bacterium]
MELLSLALLVVAGTIVIAVSDRRTVALALGILPLGVALLALGRNGGADVPALLIRLVAGGTAALLLGLGGRGGESATPADGDDEPDRWSTPFVLLWAVLLALGARYLAELRPLTTLEATFAVYWLTGAGLLALLLATHPLKTGASVFLLVHATAIAANALVQIDLLDLAAGAVFLIVFALAATVVGSAWEQARWP